MAADFEKCLSREEALEFVTERLSLANVEQRLKSERLLVLNDIMTAFHEHVPIQTIILHMTPVGERRRPCWTSVKERINEGFGGLCYELNVFMFVLLRTLGYDVSLVKSSVSRPDNHIVIITRNVSTNGELYLVDAGCGFPTFQAVDLNFENESPEYYQSFLRYKFRKKDGKIFRLHKSRTRTGNNTSDLTVVSQAKSNECAWKRYYDFNLEPKTLKEIDLCFDHVFENPTATTSHTVLRCTMFPGLRACALRNNVVLTENSDHVLEEHKYDSDDDLAEAICRNFPAFRLHLSMAKRAISCWRKIEV